MEHRAKVYEKIQRKVRHLLWNRAAADAARVTDENAGDADRKHPAGGVFVAVDNNLEAVIGKEDGAVASIPGNEGRSAQA